MIWRKRQPNWAIEQDFSWDVIGRETAINRLVENGMKEAKATAMVDRWDHEKKHGPTLLGLEL